MSTRLEEALKTATDTRECVIGDGVLAETPRVFAEQFPGKKSAFIVADPRTWAAAGEKTSALLEGSGVSVRKYILEPGGKTFHADYHYVEEVRGVLQDAGVQSGDPVPVAVGSGVVNDLTKLASGDLGVPYLVCATAASVDGYSSFGASIRSPEGAKKTYACPAPRAIVADLDVMRTAPKWMAASGFADLLAKVPAGADWILAHELGATPWHERAWNTVQGGLPEALANPEGVAAMETEPLRKFVEGLMLGGFAMQDMQSSRPASGAEHMFSHILEMRDHTYKGDIVPHGIQVGVYTHFMAKFFEQILAFDYTKLDVDACVAKWPEWPEEEAIARKLFEGTPFPEVGVTTTKAKYLDKECLRAQLMIAKTRWPEIKARLEKQLLPAKEVERRLRVVGAPAEPEEIGVTRQASFENVNVAAHMRDRYNSLDFTYRTGQMNEFARKAFGLE
ncbi:MAG: sn-glycerol-1-phosphate dehydrogenase [Kiritimatiellae bacterium]|nr:sn-glycerol-1-phosphate dehydrogenase [Kiritimatiellia bacterium]